MNLRPLTTEERNKLFGEFSYEPDPSATNASRIKVTDDWAKKHLRCVDLPPELAALGPVKHAWFHELVVPEFFKLVNAWRTAGVLGDVIKWNGSYARRCTRNGTGKLSAHAWGTAFDINAPWNRLGRKPAPEGSRGSVQRLLPYARERGWVCGADWHHPDGMHFELGRL